jgi:predicted ATP-dependent endonuclease of OLD family
MGFSTVQEVLRMHRVWLKLRKFCAICDMSLWSNGGNNILHGVNNLSPQSLLEVLKAP